MDEVQRRVGKILVNAIARALSGMSAIKVMYIEDEARLQSLTVQVGINDKRCFRIALFPVNCADTPSSPPLTSEGN